MKSATTPQGICCLSPIANVASSFVVAMLNESNKFHISQHVNRVNITRKLKQLISAAYVTGPRSSKSVYQYYAMYFGMYDK